jgi:hypothetical protein
MSHFQPQFCNDFQPNEALPVDTPLQTDFRPITSESDLQLDKCRIVFDLKRKRSSHENLELMGREVLCSLPMVKKNTFSRRWMILVCQSSNLKQIIDMKAS